MVYLENDAFLNELVRMFSKSKVKGNGTVYVIMKKFDGTKRAASPVKKSSGSNKQKKTQKVSEESSPAHACLIRAKLQNRKIATLVPAKEVNRFQLAYCSVLRGNMDALKKTKKNKSKSVKATS
ncbi:unnamed protein product [Orchesella dallaii]|uniref:Signal recognition particle 14 kDa protein n=1 Tax=Orchesella dallaii TaxID=48710 RepID=A0ABP1QXE4_9HEXA